MYWFYIAKKWKIKKKLEFACDLDVSDFNKIEIIKFDGKIYKIDLTFKNIFRLYKILKITENIESEFILKYLDINKFILNYFKIYDVPTDFINPILDYIFKTRFSNIQNNNSTKITFDLQKDFDLIYANFLRYYNINLLKDENLTWIEFNFLLEDLFLSDNSLTKRVGFRGFKKDKNMQKEYITYNNNLKNKYDLTKYDIKIKEQNDKELEIQSQNSLQSFLFSIGKF